MIKTAEIFYLACFTASLLPRPVLAEENAFVLARQKMVDEQIALRGVHDERTLNAMRKVPRHLFVPASLRSAAYLDQPLPIGRGQTISQPFIVAYMTEKALVGPEDRVLEIGTGSGYQAAILGELAKEVYSMEIIRELADEATGKLKQLGYKNVKVKRGDGYQGWPEHAPFDVIMVTAAPLEVPEALLEQLKVGGRMVLPVGGSFQELIRITRTDTGFERESLIAVIFVPMRAGE
ncbi:MAG: protein-L-isoaspartate(D-aspartate) O-methyltransferase [Candidatus Omnitrophota bacterium]